MSFKYWSTKELTSVLDAFNCVPSELWTDTHESLLDMICDELHRRNELSKYTGQFSPVQRDIVLHKVTSRYLRPRENRVKIIGKPETIKEQEYKQYIVDLQRKAMLTSWVNNIGTKFA